MKELIRQAFTIIVSRGVVRIVQFLLFVLLARFLGPNQFGWYGIITTAIVLGALLGSIGFRQSIAYHIGRTPTETGSLVSSALVIAPVLAVVTSAVLFAIYSGDVSNYFGGYFFELLACGVAVNIHILIVQGVSLGRGDIRSFSVTELVPPAACLAMVLVLIGYSEVTLASALVVYVTGFLVALGPAAWALRNAGVLGRPRLSSLGKILAHGAAFSLNLFLITACAKIGIFIVQYKIDAASAGQLFAAMRIGDVALEGAAAFGLVLFSATVRSSEEVAKFDVCARVSCFVLWAFLAASLPVILFGEAAISLLLGEDYSEAARAISMIAVGLGPAAACKIIYPMIAGAGNPLFGTVPILLCLVVNLVGAYILIPVYGINGAALSSVAGQYILFFGYSILCSSKYGVSLGHFIMPQKKDLLNLIGIVFRSR